MANERPQTVVDYDAWKRGYMPPSENILIDKLAYRGARVQLSTPISREHQIWIEVDGPTLTNKQRKAIRDMANLWFEDEPELATTTPDPTDTGSVT
jgi:type IV secretory pathway protease TraF